MNELEIEAAGYSKVYDYSQYSHDNHVNVIPEEAFRRLTSDTFGVIADRLRDTYGPYGSTVMISDQSETTTTKDGYNIFNALGFSHHYKREVYLAIKKIIERVNRRVGDGTTTCILLAEKIFKSIAPLMSTPEKKRKIEKILNDVEKKLNETDFQHNSIVKPLTDESFRNLIMLSSNYDDELVDKLIDAFDVQVNDDHEIVSIRNIIMDAASTYESTSRAEYTIQRLPGDYRCRVHFDQEESLKFYEPHDVKVILYDYTFDDGAWNRFREVYDDKTETFIIARAFSQTFVKNEFWRYYRQMADVMKMGVHVHLVQMKGDYIQDELKDLGAVLNEPVHTVHDLNLNWDELVDHKVSIFNYDCLCVYDAEPPMSYIQSIERELEHEKSFVHATILKDRIRALSLKQKDSTICVKAGTSLELKMISDKIDDCVSIAKSASDYGIVPNLLFYGNRVIREMETDILTEYQEIGSSVIDAITESIEQLFCDIWKSKYGNEKQDELCDFKNAYYNDSDGSVSFDIIDDMFTPASDLPTSAQYDIEVLIASLSIVKYLVTARALIFDAFLMTPQGDQGHFQRVE